MGIVYYDPKKVVKCPKCNEGIVLTVHPTSANPVAHAKGPYSTCDKCDWVGPWMYPIFK